METNVLPKNPAGKENLPSPLFSHNQEQVIMLYLIRQNSAYELCLSCAFLVTMWAFSTMTRGTSPALHFSPNMCSVFYLLVCIVGAKSVYYIFSAGIEKYSGHLGEQWSYDSREQQA
jgi:prolipoprotein diacylglyceryltransferase